MTFCPGAERRPADSVDSSRRSYRLERMVSRASSGLQPAHHVPAPGRLVPAHQQSSRGTAHLARPGSPRRCHVDGAWPQVRQAPSDPILRTPYQGEDYLVALAGESEWVRNVRAAHGRAVIRRRTAHPVRLVALPVDERPAVISAYIRRGTERSGAKAGAQAARYYFGLNAQPSLDEIRTVAGYYPVFRVAYLDRVEG